MRRARGFRGHINDHIRLCSIVVISPERSVVAHGTMPLTLLDRNHTPVLPRSRTHITPPLNLTDRGRALTTRSLGHGQSSGQEAEYNVLPLWLQQGIYYFMTKYSFWDGGFAAVDSLECRRMSRSGVS